jgi:hypothetical protein
MTFDHLPPPSLWREHEEAHQALWREHEKAHQAFYAELAQPPKPARPRKRKPTLAGVARPALPPTLPPRLICREDAAAYVCVSPNTFDAMVADGRMPNPD